MEIDAGAAAVLVIAIIVAGVVYLTSARRDIRQARQRIADLDGRVKRATRLIDALYAYALKGKGVDPVSAVFLDDIERYRAGDDNGKRGK
jgi:hypothetical protein